MTIEIAKEIFGSVCLIIITVILWRAAGLYPHYEDGEKMAESKS
jgi:hypothetical protein